MAQRSSFFDSSSGDRIYNSDYISRALVWCSKDGYVVGYGNQLQVTENSPQGMSVLVGTGVAWVQGRNIEVYTSSEVLSLAASSPTLPRIDRIVVRLNLSSRTVSLAVLTGTAAASPTAPSLTRNSTVWELSLARINVSAAATQITNASIVDEREDESVCGKSRHPAASGAVIFPGARVYRNTNMTITSGVFNAVSFDTVRFDTGSPVFWSAGNPTRLTVPSAGIYMITGHGEFAANSGGNDRQLFIRYNGTTLIAQSLDRNPSAYTECFSVSTIWKAAKNDYFELVGRQDSGGNLALLATTAYSPELAIIKCSD